MAISPPRSQWRFDLPQTGIERVRACREARSRWLEAGFSRRHFLGATVTAGPGFLLLAGKPSRSSSANCNPDPIPSVLELGGGLPDIHVQLPGVATPPDTDPSTITDFNGHLGLAIVDGTGVRTDLATGTQATMPFEVDLRFMKGEFVTAERRHSHGAFALI